jgi:hypothetical protein
MTRLTPYRLRKLRKQFLAEAALLDAVSERHLELVASLPAPSLDELRELEAGEVPMPLEAYWISVLSEQALLLSDAAGVLIYEGEEQTRSRLNLFWYRGRLPSAKRIAHLRGALQGRTLPKNFKLPDPGVPAWCLLYGQDGILPAGTGLVTDLLLKGYKWER